MALLSQFFTALLLLHFGLQLVGGSEAAAPQTLSCPASAGVPGSPGHNGLPGRDGREGAAGPKGDKGEPGLSVQGPLGKAGPEGPSGTKGDKGEPGLSVQGPPGKAGPEGPVGPAGPNGQKGDPGPSGTLNTVLITSLQSELQSLKTRLSTIDKVLNFSTFKKVGQKFFVTTGLKATFDEGLKFCTDAGGTLALPRNEAENQVLTKMIKDLAAPHAYVGATDRDKEDTFADILKVPLTFTKWAQNEPNNANEEDCAGIVASGEWNDFPCATNIIIICEIENAQS